MPLFLFAITACDEQAAASGGGRALDEFVGLPGTTLVLAPAEAPEEEPLQLRLSAELWEARLGSDWDDAAVVGEWPVVLKKSLEVDGVTMLSEPLPDGEEVEVRYGTFPEAVSVEVEEEEGAFAGDWVFALSVGPIVATLDGVRRECVVYSQEAQAE